MQTDKSTRVVARWIFLGVAMLIVQVLLGGITRLTGSGLSITEWKPIMGALPPLNETEWQKAFAQYQQIAQYKYLNTHFALGDFKFIFFWEWFHRLWARFIGVVFLIPFIYFLVKGYFKRWMIFPLVALFMIGALQGALGWIMVQSGLNDNDLYVSHIRLAVHFIAAMLLIAYALIFGLKLIVSPIDRIGNRTLYNGAIVITVLLIIQLIYGAFMAGLKAAAVASTWPDINGDLVPAGMFANGLHDAVHNKIAIHFIHRNLAYLLAIIIFAWWWKSTKVKTSTIFNRVKNFALILVLTQVLLGILSVITSPYARHGSFGQFEYAAQLHQLVGMLLFLNFVAAIYLTARQQQRV